MFKGSSWHQTISAFGYLLISRPTKSNGNGASCSSLTMAISCSRPRFFLSALIS